MKTAAVLFAIVLAGSGILQAQEALAISKSFPTHGTLMMEVNFGEVRIERSDETKTIRLTIDPRGGAYDAAEMQSWIQRFDVSGDHAALAVKLPQSFHGKDGSSSPRITVFLPTYTDIKFEMGAGQLTVKGIEGNKDLHIDIGQMTVGVTDSATYNEIRASAKLGQANDNLFGERSGGFFPRTAHDSAQGLYKLRATVDIGQVDIVRD